MFHLSVVLLSNMFSDIKFTGDFCKTELHLSCMHCAAAVYYEYNVLFV